MRTVILGAAIGLAGCSQPPQLAVEDAWVRLSAVSGRPAAAYFTLHGGPVDRTLINVTTDVAVRSEMHESMAAGMVPIGNVRVPADGELAFRPGGRHVMLFNVNPGIKPGGRRVLVTFTFSDGTRLQRRAGVLGAAEPIPE